MQKRVCTFAKIFVCVLIFLPLFAQVGRAQSISFRLTAVNPSSSKTQTTEVKGYLPKEVQPGDIIDDAGLEVFYDEQKGLYYVYRGSIQLAPKEIRLFEIQVNDIWVIPETELTSYNETTESLLELLIGTDYYAKADTIAYGIFDRIGQIRTSQEDDTQTKEEHIGSFRANQVILDKIKEDIARLEKIVVVAGGPLAPDMLADADIKSDSPTKTMTWIVIFSIIVFTAIIAGVLFFTWQHQARLSHEALSESRNEAFPEDDDDSKKEES
ncbi:hypothetical protein IIB34_00755 [PVC group bacterium]|nr:hypothetical protein [PVC group bacterium]